jgi:DNA-binding SARP family transcriptional activator
MSGSDVAEDTSPGVLPLEIRVLGPLEILCDGRAVEIGGLKTRALVARLLIDRGLVVSVDRIVDSLWGEHDGEGGEVALRSTISRLRKRLHEASAPEDLLGTRAPGYVLQVSAEVTDAHRFEQLVAEARRQLTRHRPNECTRLLTEAEDLWRGPAYSEVRDEPFARAEVRRLDELRLAATETRIDAELTMGRHHTLIGELETLASEHPMRERLWSQRMLALYRCGRQAEALRVFQDLRSILVAELGIEPGHDVTWMEHAILAHEPALDFPVRPERDAEAAGAARAWPRLPPGDHGRCATRRGPGTATPGRLAQVPARGRAVDELSHHVVGKQDVGRVLDDFAPVLGIVLPRVTPEGDKLSSGGKADLKELAQLVLLAVGQRVHRVDDHGLDAVAAALAEHPVHDGDDVGEALPRAGAGGDDVVVAAGGSFDGLGLVAV